MLWRCLLFSLLSCPPFLCAQSQAPLSLSDLALAVGAPHNTDSKLHAQVVRLFGRDNLQRGKPKAKVEDTLVAWAILDPTPARVVRDDGTLIGNMTRLGNDGLQILVKEWPNFQEFNYRIEVDGMARVAGQVRVEHFPHPPESQRQPGVPEGTLKTFEWSQSRIYPNTTRQVTVYIPQQYQFGDQACLMVWQDGSRHAATEGNGLRVPIVLDNLIHEKAMPVTIGVFVDPGRLPHQSPQSKAANRSLEYDSLGNTYVRFLIEEILPETEKRFGVRFRPEPQARAIAGGSSGGICAFTAAWERPDQFHKVLSWVGTFVDIRGGNAYPYLLRITERKPLRIYLLDGSNDLDNKFGNWPLANRMMEASLKYMKYDHRVDWDESFHGSKGMAARLPEALRWLWRDVK